MDNLWRDHLKAKKPPYSDRRMDCKPKFYADLPKVKAKLMLCLEVGELNLRANRKNEAMRKYGNYECLIPACRGDDSLDHIKECRGYPPKWKDGAGPYEIAEYLTKIEEIRNREFKRSLINFKTL